LNGRDAVDLVKNVIYRYLQFRSQI
jgi:hypothetical protein